MYLLSTSAFQVPEKLKFLQLISKNVRPSFPVIPILRFHNVTSGILEEIESLETIDNDKNTETAHDSSLLLAAERISLSRG
jgi:hypothetical protein